MMTDVPETTIRDQAGRIEVLTAEVNRLRDQVVEVASLRNEVNALRMEKEVLVRERDHVRNSAHELQRRHDQFRTEVRDVAIRVADEQGWCDDGLNEVLAELGLDPVERLWVVTLEVTVKGDDEDDARANLRYTLDQDDDVKDYDISYVEKKED